MERWADGTNEAAGRRIRKEVAGRRICKEAAGRRIRKEAALATRVSGKAPKIVDHRSEGTANHTKHTRLTETNHPLRQRPPDNAAMHVASRRCRIRTKALPHVARMLAYLRTAPNRGGPISPDRSGSKARHWSRRIGGRNTQQGGPPLQEMRQ